MDKHEKILADVLKDMSEQKRKTMVKSLKDLGMRLEKKKIRLSLRFETIQDED